MKNVFKLLLIILLVTSCNNGEEIIDEGITENSDYTEFFGDTFINQNLNKFAQDLAVALKDENFAADIHYNIGLKFDGDYDYLLDYALQERQDAKRNLKKTFKSYLYSATKANGEKKSNLDDYIEILMEIYPNLQISVPLHYEKWQPGDDIWVTFVPEEGAESVEYVIAYNQDLEKKIFSSKVEPTIPVVVIGLNERTSVNETTGKLVIKKEYLKNLGNFYGREVIEEDEPLPPSCITNLTVTPVPLGLKLDWTRADNSIADVFLQYVERTGGGSNDWVRIAVLGPTETTFTDYDLPPNLYYSYRIITENSYGQCISSNVGGVAPESIQPPASFTANVPNTSSAREFEFRWSAFQSTPHTGYELSRKRVGIDSDYIKQAEFPHDVYNYTETNVQPGVQYNYSLQHTGAKDQVGAPRYTTITYPYRDRFNSYLTLDYIEWDSRVESWLNGAPEFLFKIYTVNKSSGNSVINLVPNGFEYDWQGGAKTKTNIDIQHNFFNWIPMEWMDIVTISAVEEDAYIASATQVIEIITKYNNLAETLTEFVKLQQTPADEKPEHKFKNNDSKDLGRLYIQFQQPPNVHWYAAYGVEIKFTDN